MSKKTYLTAVQHHHLQSQILTMFQDWNKQQHHSFHMFGPQLKQYQCGSKGERGFVEGFGEIGMGKDGKEREGMKGIKGTGGERQRGLGRMGRMGLFGRDQSEDGQDCGEMRQQRQQWKRGQKRSVRNHQRYEQFTQSKHISAPQSDEFSQEYTKFNSHQQTTSIPQSTLSPISPKSSKSRNPLKKPQKISKKTSKPNPKNPSKPSKKSSRPLSLLHGKKKDKISNQIYNAIFDHFN